MNKTIKDQTCIRIGKLLAIAFILHFFCGCGIVTRPIQKSERFPRLAGFFQFWAPADDLFKAIYKENIDLSTNSQYEFTIRHPYVGRYEGFIRPIKEALLIEEKYWDFVIRADFYIGNKIVFSDEISRETHSNNQGVTYGGIHLFLYDVPKDLPRNKPIRCVVRVVKPGRMFLEKYGPSRLAIRRRCSLW